MQLHFEVNDEEMSEGSTIARVKGVCSQQTIQWMMSLVINATRRQRETDGDGEVVRKEQVMDDSANYAVCKEQGASALQMTAAKFLDVI